MQKLLKKLFFPVECVSCKIEGEWVCSDCWRNCARGILGRCYICKKVGKRGLCEGCRKFTGLDELICAFSYKNPAISSLIIAAKYAHQTDALNFLAQKFLLEGFAELPEFDAVTFVPSSAKSFRERGFLHTKIITDRLFQTGTRVKLVKFRQTKAQAGLNKMERAQNIKNSFIVLRRLDGKTVIVVDDVITTGATLKEAARALKDVGAKKVIGVTLAYD